MVETMRLALTVDSTLLQATLRDLARLETAYAGADIAFASPSSATLERFLALPGAEQVRIAEKAARFVESMIADGEILPTPDLETEITNLKRVFAKIGLRCPDDLFSKIEKGEIIEIYNPDGFQVYHNIEWLKLSSYSLLDVMVFPFYELFDRPSSIVEAIRNEGFRAFSQSAFETTPMMVPKHMLRERLSAENREFVVEFRNVAPLHDGEGKSRAVVILQRASRLTDDLTGVVSFI